MACLRSARVAAIAVLALTYLAGEGALQATGQFSGGKPLGRVNMNYFNGGRQSGYNPRMPSGQSSHQSHSTGSDVGNILLGVGNILGNIPKPVIQVNPVQKWPQTNEYPRRTRYVESHNHNYQRHYPEREYVRPEPTVVKERIIYRDAPREVVAPPRNEVVTHKEPPVNELPEPDVTAPENTNANLALLRGINSRADAVLGGLEVEETNEIQRALQESLANLLQQDANSPNPQAPPEMLADLENLLAEPDNLQLKDDFLTKWGNQFGPGGGVKDQIKQLVEADRSAQIYKDGIANGVFSPQGKDDALADLSKHLNQLDQINIPGNGNADAKIALGAERLNDLNTFGKLVDLYGPGTTGNYLGGYDPRYPPVEVLIDGAQSADFPPEYLTLISGAIICEAPALPDAMDEELDATEMALVVNPASNGQTIRYQIRNRHYELAPGREREHPSGGAIEFHDGRDDTHRYRLTPAKYRFSVSSAGWSLFKDVVRVVIDNSGMSTDFHYLIGDQKHTLAPGETASHKGNSEIEVQFDRGSGPAARKLLQKGHYYVGVDAGEKRIDLFEESAIDTDLPSAPEIHELAQAIDTRRRSSPQRRSAFDALIARLRGDTSATPFMRTVTHAPETHESLLNSLKN